MALQLTTKSKQGLLPRGATGQGMRFWNCCFLLAGRGSVWAGGTSTPHHRYYCPVQNFGEWEGIVPRAPEAKGGGSVTVNLSVLLTSPVKGSETHSRRPGRATKANGSRPSLACSDSKQAPNGALRAFLPTWHVARHLRVGWPMDNDRLHTQSQPHTCTSCAEALLVAGTVIT